MDADDENKFAHSTGHLVEINKVTQAFLKLEEDFKTSRKILSTRLDRHMGECLTIDVIWDHSYSLVLVEGTCLLFEGKANIDAEIPWNLRLSLMSTSCQTATQKNIGIRFSHF